jgi:spoIIIJ-associated protein
MDWITTSGRTLDEAKSHALDQLGIVADEAEFDVVNDVEKGLFGRVKSEAKIRARVRPKQTAVKEDRGRRRNSGSGKGRGNSAKGGSRNKGPKDDGGRNGDSPSETKSSDNPRNSRGGDSGGQRKQSGNRGGNNKNRDEAKDEKSNNRPKSDTPRSSSDKPKKDTVEEHMNRADQERAAQDFLEGVLGVFEMTGSVAVAEEAADDDAIEMVVTGSELGLLVGQKGVTLNALQELTRTVVQRRAEGAKTDRLRVDVAGYRARRTEALQAFAVKIAEDVLESGTEKLLEPMGPADRKVVHDAVNGIDGVETGSEGEEPRRRVVIRPV